MDEVRGIAISVILATARIEDDLRGIATTFAAIVSTAQIDTVEL